MARKRNSGVSPPTVGLAVFIAVLVGFFIGRATGPTETTDRKTAEAPKAVEVADAAPAAKKLKLDPAPAKGPKDAPVVIYEISEFQ